MKLELINLEQHYMGPHKGDAWNTERKQRQLFPWINARWQIKLPIKVDDPNYEAANPPTDTLELTKSYEPSRHD